MVGVSSESGLGGKLIFPGRGGCGLSGRGGFEAVLGSRCCSSIVYFGVVELDYIRIAFWSARLFATTVLVLSGIAGLLGKVYSPNSLAEEQVDRDDKLE